MSDPRPQIGAMPGYLVPRLASAQRPPTLANHSTTAVNSAKRAGPMRHALSGERAFHPERMVEARGFESPSYFFGPYFFAHFFSCSRASGIP